MKTVQLGVSMIRNKRTCKMCDKVFFSVQEVVKSGSPPHIFHTYEGARRYLQDSLRNSESCGNTSKCSIHTHFDMNSHFDLIAELIQEYDGSENDVEELMVVFFSESKRYDIAPKSHLTNKNWLIHPYTILGSLNQFQKQ